MLLSWKRKRNQENSQQKKKKLPTICKKWSSVDYFCSVASHPQRTLCGLKTWQNCLACGLLACRLCPHECSAVRCSAMADSLWPHGLQHARPPCPSPTPGVHSNSCASSWWCYTAISPSVVPFSFRLQSFPASGPFQMSQFFTSGGWNIGVSAWASVLPMTIQGWFPLGCTGWISLQSKGLSRVFSNTTVQKHQSFGTHWYRSSMINLSLILECNLQSNFGFTHKLCITSL